MENVIVFNIKSALGSFMRPQSRNNPDTFNIIPKSALVGIISAVIGLDREFMKENNMYKILTEKLKYSIRLRSPFQKKFWCEYGYNHGNVFQCADRSNYTPTKFERLVNVDYDVYILYDNNDTNINPLLEDFINNIKANEFVFLPYMGMANFFADITYIGVFEPKACCGKFKTYNFCTNLVLDESQPFENIGTDDIPTTSISYLGHNNKSYKTIFFHNNCDSLDAEGNYFLIQNECVEFI